MGEKNSEVGAGSFFQKVYESPSLFFMILFFAASGLLFIFPGASLALLLAGPAIEDYKTGYVDDRWSLVTAVTGIIYRLQEGSFFDGLISFLIVSVIYGIIFMVDKNGIGTGDIFLSAALSFWLNPSGVIFFICASSLSGAAAALVLILFCGCGRKDTLRFCPFIALGGVLAYVWQDALEILAWRLYSP